MRRWRLRRGVRYVLFRLLFTLLLAAIIYFWYTRHFGPLHNPFNVSFETYQQLQDE